MMTSIILVVVLTIDIALTIHKLIAMHKLLKLIENGEISYIQAVHNICRCMVSILQRYEEVKPCLGANATVKVNHVNKETNTPCL